MMKEITENIKNISIVIIAILFIFSTTDSCERKNQKSVLEEYLINDNKRLQTESDSLDSVLKKAVSKSDSIGEYVLFLKEEIIKDHEEIKNLTDIDAIDSVYLEYKNNRPRN